MNDVLCVTRVQSLPGYCLRLQFSDGSVGEVSLADRLSGPVFSPLQDERLFAQAYIDDGGGVAWPVEHEPALSAYRLKSDIVGYSVLASSDSSLCTGVDSR